MVDTSALAAESWAFLRWLRNTGIAIAARMPMMMMTTRSSMRVKPPSRSSRALRIRASIALPPERKSEPRGAGSPRGLRMESGRGSPADPLLGPVALRPRLTTGVLLLALRLDDDQVIGRTVVRLEPL